jgi:hypothetical protein
MFFLPLRVKTAFPKKLDYYHGLLVGAGLQEAENHSLLPHSQRTNVFFGSNWVLGEVRECSAFPLTEGTFNYLDCGGNADVVKDELWHFMAVRYWGRIQRRDKIPLVGQSIFEGGLDVRVLKPREKRWAWDCKREADSITCSALN